MIFRKIPRNLAVYVSMLTAVISGRENLAQPPTPAMQAGFEIPNLDISLLATDAQNIGCANFKAISKSHPISYGPRESPSELIFSSRAIFEPIRAGRNYQLADLISEALEFNPTKGVKFVHQAFAVKFLGAALPEAIQLIQAELKAKGGDSSKQNSPGYSASGAQSVQELMTRFCELFNELAKSKGGAIQLDPNQLGSSELAALEIYSPALTLVHIDRPSAATWLAINTAEVRCGTSSKLDPKVRQFLNRLSGLEYNDPKNWDLQSITKFFAEHGGTLY